MSSENRSAIIAKLVKVAKKYYPVVNPPQGRTVIEHLLYATLLENGDFSAADEAFARFEQYSDWNEVRVSTTQELSEAAAQLLEADAAVDRLKTALHSIFETHYVYELDFLIKESQGKAIAQLEKYKGVTPFVISYLVQNCFAGHKIPVSAATIELADALGLLTPKERESGNVPGLERAVPKTKGVEFFSTLHQFAIAFKSSPHDKLVLARIKEVNPAAVKRLELQHQEAEAASTTSKKATAEKTSSKSSGKGKSSEVAENSGKAASTPVKTGATDKSTKDSKPASPSKGMKQAEAKPADPKGKSKPVADAKTVSKTSKAAPAKTPNKSASAKPVPSKAAAKTPPDKAKATSSKSTAKNKPR